MKNMINTHTCTIPIFFFLFTQTVQAGTDCSQQAIGFYLERGFTHEQVIQLCSDTPQPTAADTKQPTDMRTVTGEPIAAQQPALTTTVSTNRKDDDLLFFSANILADDVSISPDVLVYVRNECIKYGEEDIAGFRPKVCGTIRTTIQRSGLKIKRASRGIPFIRDTELLVQGDIRREVINPETLSKKERETFANILDSTPNTHDILLRNDADPKIVAKRLPK